MFLQLFTHNFNISFIIFVLISSVPLNILPLKVNLMLKDKRKSNGNKSGYTRVILILKSLTFKKIRNLLLNVTYVYLSLNSFLFHVLPLFF